MRHSSAQLPPRNPSIPITGPATPPGMGAWDQAAEELMSDYHLPGAALAVAYQGRVQHGYGYADVTTRTPVQPDSRFRLASVTKSLTAAAVDVLLREHRLSLGTRPFQTILNRLRGPHGSRPVDPRLRQITVADLLNMKGGWDIGRLRFDPVFDAGPEEHALGLRSAPTCEQSIEYMLSKRLDWAPGTHYSYSNLGFCVLGDTIAHVMHTSYGPYRLSLLASLGAAGMVSTAPDLERYLIVTGGAVPGSKPWPVFGGSKYVGILAPPPAVTGYGWEWDGSLPGTSTSMIVQGPVTVVFGSNSRPANGPDYSILSSLAQQQSSWPAGNLLSPPAP